MIFTDQVSLIFKYIIKKINLLKANFKISKNENQEGKDIVQPTKLDHEIDDKEFEEFMVKNGAAGSFMVFRDAKEKISELGIDEL